MTSRLASLLVQENLVSAKKMAEAFQRQVIYGGTLDTILLEMDVLDEVTLLEALGRSSALPTAGDLPSLEQLQAADITRRVPHAMSDRYRAVPVALEGNVLRVLVIDPPDRRQLDELGYTLSLTIDPIVVPEHRFVQAVELVYGVAVPARFASLAAKLRQRATDPNRARLVPVQPALPQAPARERRDTPAPVRERRDTPAPVRERHETPAPRERRDTPARLQHSVTPVVDTHVVDEPRVVSQPPTSSDERREVERRTDERRGDDFLAVPERREPEERRVEERRAVVTDVPMPTPSPAPSTELSEQLTPRLTTRQPSAPQAPLAGETAAPITIAAEGEAVAPLSADEARKALDEAGDRDGIFDTLCRGARSRLPFAAIFTVHGDIAAGRVALATGFVDRNTLAGIAVGLDRPSPFRAAAVGRAPYLGRIGEDHQTLMALAGLGRKPPLAAVLMPIVLRERAVALLYADADGNELEADVIAELSTLVAAAARSFQRLILRAKGGDYAKAPTGAAGKLAAAATGGREESDAQGGQWRQPEVRRNTQPRFGVALVNAIKAELTGEPQRSPNPPREDAAPQDELHDAPTAPLPDVEGLLLSVERGDEHAQMSADALVAIGERAAAALVARLPGPLRLDRHALRGAAPSLEHHGPLLAVLARMGKMAKDPLLARLGDASLEVRYYATLALGELKLPETVTPLGARLYDPDSSVRRAAVDALAKFSDSPPLRALVERLRAELLGPDVMRQRYAAEAVGILKDVPSVPRLIELVRHGDPNVVTASRKALVDVTKQDFGTSRWRWRSWWERHRDEPRVEWMLEGLAHAEPEVRLSASEELRGVTSEYFGYAFDLPKREREDARRKWVEWYRENGAKLQDKR